MEHVFPWDIQIFMFSKKQTLLIVLLLCSLGSTYDFIGGRLDHMETGMVELTSAGQFTKTFDRSNIFSATEDIFIANGILGFEAQVGLNDVATQELVTHIEVTNLRLNALRTAVIFTLDLTPDTGTASVVNFVQMTYIVVGSDFSGFIENSPTSSYVFVRTSSLIAGSSDNSLAIRVGFENTDMNLKGPFNYDPTFNAEGRCGAIRDDNGDWRITTAGCMYKGIHLYVAGFSSNPSPAQTNTERPLLARLVSYLANENDYAITISTTGNDGIDLFFPANLIQPADQPVFYQVTMVFIGIRDYTPGQYPAQSGLFDDDFSFNSILTQYNQNNPGPSTPVFTFIGVPAPNTQTFNPAVSNQNYYATTNMETAHVFCGYIELNFLREANVPTTNFYGFRTDEVSIVTPFTLTITSTQTDFNIMKVGISCTMFTGVPPFCLQANTPLLLDGAPTSAAVPATGTVTFSSAPFAAHVGSVYTGSAATGTLLSIQQTSTEATVFTYTLLYAGVMSNMGYEGVVHFIGDSNLAFNAKVEVFGTVIFDGTVTLPATPAITSDTKQFAFLNTGTSSTVVITIEMQGPIPQLSIQFGIDKHMNLVVLPENQCVNFCPPRTGFTAGINGESNVPPLCVYCRNDLFQMFDPVSQSCICAFGRADVSGVCQPCTDMLCKTCLPTNLATCSECMDNAAFVSGVCQCNSGYHPFDNGLHMECRLCPTGCVSCTSQTTCVTCVTSTTRLGPEAACACQPGFYEVGMDECAACSPECQQCETTATTCTVCDTANNFVKEGTTCQCIDGYYKRIGTTETTCELCHYSCLKCEMRDDKCTECKEFRDLNGLFQCPCRQGFTEYNQQCINEDCTLTDPNCQDCHILLEDPGKVVCKQCMQPRVLDSEKKCVCKVGFHEVSGTCVACGEGCQICTDVNNCDACAFNSVNDTDGTCSCLKGTYLAEQNNLLSCLPCAINCADCYEMADKCRECKNGYVAVQEVCVCPDKTYEVVAAMQCLPCMMRCLRCTSGTTCDECEPQTVYDGSQCAIQCPDGTYNAGNECKQCSQFCSKCTSSFMCTLCFIDYFRIAGACQAFCPPGTYALGNECLACLEPCATCFGTNTNCTGCKSGMFLFNNNCIAECAVGTYFSNNNCLPCDSSCLTCMGVPTFCESCSGNLFLVDNKCVAECPFPLVNGICRTQCPAGTYPTGQSCDPCQGDCSACENSPTFCTQCKTGFAYNGQCVSVCPPNTLTFESNCVDCDASCNGCSVHPFSCHSCRPNFYQLNQRCVTQCPDGYYTDFGMQACRKCDMNCKICSGPGRCAVCTDPTQTPINGLCNNPCGANCLNCVDMFCQLCNQGTSWNGMMCVSICPSGAQAVNGICVCNSGVLFQSQCVSQCPDGFAQINNICRRCDASCATCVDSIFKCTSCPVGFQLDQVSFRCQSVEPCPLGRFRNFFGACAIICPPNSYFLDSTCYFDRCPPGYKINTENQACMLDDTNIGCSTPFFLQGRQCQLVCDIGFYPNPSNRVCEPCASNCYFCLSASFCLLCNEGFETSNFQCVSSSGCPNNLVLYQNVCMQFCPPGTYNRNGFCLRICPPATKLFGFGCYQQCGSLMTPDACVDTCPTGFTQNTNNCDLNSQQCADNQYFNAQMNSCQNCQFPCSKCIGNAITCTACVNGFTYNAAQNICTRTNNCPPGQYSFGNTCVNCPEKCATCINEQQCETCASGFTNTGSDCIRNQNELLPIEMSAQASIRDNTVFLEVSLSMTMVLSGLPLNLQSQSMLVVLDDATANPLITMWVQDEKVWVALRFNGAIPTTTVYVLINTDLIGSQFISAGYNPVNAFAVTTISSQLPLTDPSVQIPIRAAFSKKSDEGDVNILQSRVVNAIREDKRRKW